MMSFNFIMKCPHCNEPFHPKGAKFCHVCGEPLDTYNIKENMALKIFFFIITTIFIIAISYYEGTHFRGLVAVITIIVNFFHLSGNMTHFYKRNGIFIFIPTTIGVVSNYFLALFLPNWWGIIIGFFLAGITMSLAESIDDYELS